MRHVLYLENNVWFSVTIPASGPPLIDSWSIPDVDTDKVGFKKITPSLASDWLTMKNQ